MTSKYLGPLALKGLNKVGDVFLPGFEEFPSFSQLGCVESVDLVLEDLPADDRGSVAILLSVFYFLPSPFLKIIFIFFDWSENKPIPLLGSIFRQIRLGIRGILFSLYYSGWKGQSYSGKTPHEILGYSLNVIRS